MEAKKPTRNWNINFEGPIGEASLPTPDSMSWRIYKNPITLNIGAMAAVLYEFADPRVRTGVWDNSVFKVDPVGRGRRTAAAALAGVYAPASEAERIIGIVTRMHGKVRGQTSSGLAYSALDPVLLDWVGATGVFCALRAYECFVAPITDAQRQSFYAEQADILRIYGSTSPILSEDDFERMLAKHVPVFEAHPINIEYLDTVSSLSPGRGIPQGMQKLMVKAAVSLLHPVVRESLQLGPEYDLGRFERALVRIIGKYKDVTPDTDGIPARASERMGLPRDFLWKSKSQQRRLMAEVGVGELQQQGV